MASLTRLTGFQPVGFFHRAGSPQGESVQIEEFKQYRLPDWLRDFGGILKITFAICLLVGIGRARGAIEGGVGIAVLMAGAVITHLRVKNPPFKMLPSATLLVLSLVIAYLNYRMV